MKKSAHCHIKMENVYVDGIDTSARASTLRQLLVRRGKARAVKIPILHDISLDIKPGDRVGLIGRNGSGKSSLLKAICSIYPTAKGKISVVGKIVPLVEMGVGFNPELSGRQNIKISLIYSGRLADYSPELEQKIIEFSELGDKIDLPLKTYSSGMHARLAFSTSIFQHPDILILDEVFATGDAGFIEKSQKLLNEKINSVPITIMVNHSAESILRTCNKVYILENGRLYAEGEPEEMIKLYNTKIANVA